MRQDVVRGRRRQSGALVEVLEGRQLLTAAVVATLPDVGTVTGGGVQAVELGGYFKDAALPANTVFIQTSLGNIPVLLTPDATPLTVANFMNYVSSGRYDGTFFHRSVPGFVVQGGGFATDNGQVVSVQTDAPVQNEPGQSNVRGTVAMAKLGGDPNSATSQFFFNLANNASNLDAQNGGFTVFGHVLGPQGLAVMDALAAVPVVNAGGTFSDLPVIGYQSGQGDIRFDQLVYINAVTSGAAFSAVSDNPSVLAVGVRDSRLLYQAQGAGVANVTVTAKGLDGQAVSQTFKVTVVSPATGDGSGDDGQAVDDGPTVTVGAGGVNSVTYRDKDGTETTITLSGPGSATVHLDGSGVSVKTAKKVATVSGQNVSVGSIVLDGATAKTVVTVTTKGGDGMADVGGIVSAGAMGSLDGEGVNLVGATVVTGAIRSLDVGSTARGSSITAGSLRSLAVGGNSMADVVVDGAVRDASVEGTMKGTWRAGRVKNLEAGVMARANVTTTAAGGTSMGSVSAGRMKGSVLRSAGGIASVDVAVGMAGSQVFAGVPADGAVSAEVAAAGHGVIGSIRVGSGGGGKAFANSAIAAGTIRNAVLGNVADVAGTGDFNGIEAGKILNMTGFVNGQAFSVSKVRTQEQLDSQLAAEKVKIKKVKIVVV